jgi:hypothetical protein
MNQAIYATTGNPVYVLAVNGGWSTIRDVNGQESKVRNSALHPVLTQEIVVQTAKAEQIKAESKARYAGPMLALRAAAKSYVKGMNGNPHCGDVLASALSGLDREQVVEVLIYALRLEGNPYSHLNPGQQSMNLRNKARTAMKNGALKGADIELAVHEVTGLGITN